VTNLVIFLARYFLKSCLFVVSPYTIARSASYPPNLLSYASKVIYIVPEVCHKVNQITDRHLEFDPTGNGAVGSAVPENPTLEPNMKGIG